MTPETTAAELRRLEHIVYDLDAKDSDTSPYDWMRFIDPAMGGYTVGEAWRYANERAVLAYGIARGPVDPPPNAHLRLCDLSRRKAQD